MRLPVCMSVMDQCVCVCGGGIVHVRLPVCMSMMDQWGGGGSTMCDCLSLCP